ncbi:MAG: DUF1501 domain-containing protein [bacterium]|nr:DUF1501 domain-containing protein [bacterium]
MAIVRTKNLSRRDFLRGSAAMSSALAAQAALPAWMPRFAFAPAQQAARGDVLVSIFLRGGADALNMVVPHGEEAYYQARPQLAIARPDDSSAEGRTLDLDGFFGLHPAFAPLLPVFQNGGMMAIHNTGSPHETRSHFEAMDFMERGTPGDYGVSSGWIGRHLSTLNNGSDSPVRAVGWGTSLQASLRGVLSPVVLESIANYHLAGDVQAAARMMQSLGSLYALQGDSLTASAEATRAAVDVLAQVGYQHYRPANGAQYPETDFAMALRQTAALIRADVGLEASCIDLGGWDTHINQGGAEGQQARLMSELAQGLAAFHADMGDQMARVSVVVMSEFGRRVAENSGRGTDHGHGGAILYMNGQLNGTPVTARWVGLNQDVLDRGEDLPITIDYRDVLSEIITRRLGNPATSEIFPGYTPTEIGLFRA